MVEHHSFASAREYLFEREVVKPHKAERHFNQCCAETVVFLDIIHVATA